MKKEHLERLNRIREEFNEINMDLTKDFHEEMEKGNARETAVISADMNRIMRMKGNITTMLNREKYDGMGERKEDNKQKK